MRPVTVFAISFVCAVLLGAVLLPAHPPGKSRHLARPVAVKAPPIESATSQLMLPPAMPALANAATDPYETARAMMLKGRLREARDLYLRILLEDPLIDQRAIQGLARAQGLLARGDPAALLQQAEMYRRTIARTAETVEGYSPRALELLAEANLLAAQAIQAAQAAKFPGVGTGAPDVSGIPRNTLSGPGARVRGAKPVLPAIMKEVVRVGTALTPGSASSPLPTVNKPITGNPEIVVPIPVPAGRGTPVVGGTGDQGEPGSSSGWGGAPARTSAPPGSGRGGSPSGWGSEPAGTPTDKGNTNP